MLRFFSRRPIKQSSQLLLLPTDVIGVIASMLEIKDVAGLRIICKELQKKIDASRNEFSYKLHPKLQYLRYQYILKGSYSTLVERVKLYKKLENNRFRYPSYTNEVRELQAVAAVELIFKILILILVCPLTALILLGIEYLFLEQDKIPQIRIALGLGALYLLHAVNECYNNINKPQQIDDRIEEILDQGCKL